MLTGKFSEGSSGHDASNPLELPEDDPSAMWLMCMLLTHLISDVKKIEPTQLPELAVICDKYQCLISLRIAFQMRLNQYVLDAKKAHGQSSGNYSPKQMG